MRLLVKIFANISSITAVILSGCAPQTNTPDVRLKDYASERAAIKTSLSDPAQIEYKLTQLKKRYGITESQNVERIDTNHILHQLRKMKPIQPSSGVEVTETNQILAKTAISGTGLGVKCKDYEGKATYISSQFVSVGQRLVVSCNALIASCDPFVVLYTVNNGNLSNYTLQQMLTIRAFSDDYSGSNAMAEWINSTKTGQEVVILAFPYSSSSGGNANVCVNLQNPVQGGYENVISYFDIASLSGTTVYSNNGNFKWWGKYYDCPCVMTECQACNAYFGEHYLLTTSENGNLKGVSNYGNPKSNGADTYIWAFNFSTMKGIANDDRSSSDYSSEISTFYLPLAGTEYARVLGSNHLYPNMVLLGSWGRVSNATMVQLDTYWRE